MCGGVEEQNRTWKAKECIKRVTAWRQEARRPEKANCHDFVSKYGILENTPFQTYTYA